ncbi:MAG: FAD-dependent oxidoreductase, partial [Proteobacteria bacterium]|nr:FAD-dependent oxidoreductase [Pseudomonadota bacterium]
MAEKLGVYICGGCGIADSIDTEALAEFTKNGKHSSLCSLVKTNSVLCSPDAKAEIEADIKAEGLDGVVICACSPRAKWDVFAFGATQVNRVSLRELGVWSFQDDAKYEDLQMVQAKDYVNMGITYLSKSKVPAPEIEPCNTTIMVLGGGFTGLNAALDAAKAGRDVVLVEKEDALGGKAAGMYKFFPMSDPYTALEANPIPALIEAVNASAKITVKTGVTVSELKGAPGHYTAVVGGEELSIGSVVLATGWVPGKAEYLAPLGYGKFKNVVTTKELEAMAAGGGIKRP